MKNGFLLVLLSFVLATTNINATDIQHPRKSDVIEIIKLVNNYWQTNNPNHGNYFWNRAVYHVGNMEAYRTTGEEAYLNFSKAWAERNNYSGATDRYSAWGQNPDKPTNWSYQYGENNVLFGDCQICFQVYSELYDVYKEEHMLERARQIMGYEIQSDTIDYLWWVDGLFMVMPVLTHMYKQTGDITYLNRMHDYWTYSVELMWDEEEDLFYRDGSYVYPKHTTTSGKKDFWARGDGWMFAAFARMLQDMPEDAPYREEYISYYRRMAESLKRAQQPEGHWSRSIIDIDEAPGYETSGTELMLYGYLWGINNGIFAEADYAETVDKAWRYLTDVALMPNGRVGYIQPIGASASPGTFVGATSTADFGVGGFLLAASEMSRYATEDGYEWTRGETEPLIDTKRTYTILQKASGLYLNLDNDVRLQEEPTIVSFVPAEVPGSYYITNGTEYVGMKGTNNWTMSNAADKKSMWSLISLGNDEYNIFGPNGCIGSDKTDADSPCYGDKDGGASRSVWIITATAQPELTDTIFEVPEDCTGKIVNPSFETGNLNGWINNGFQTQSNNESKSGKVGRYYAEKWVKAPSHLGDSGISQRIDGLENGEYIISAVCHSENQSGNPAVATGTYLSAGDNLTEVNTTGIYEVQGTAVNGHLTIGFKNISTTANWVSVDNFTLKRIGESGTNYLRCLHNMCQLLDSVATNKRLLDEELRQAAHDLVASCTDDKLLSNDDILDKIAEVEYLYDECVAWRRHVDYNDNSSAYLFVYFPNNNDENLYYAISEDGFNYTPLNEGKRVMASDTVALKKGIRDPHILRGVDGKTFYMVATDMRSAEGWSSNRGIVMYKSTDLIHWEHSTVHFPTRFPEWKNVTRVWAPETIWDPDYKNEDGTLGRYMIYYSLLTNDGKCTYDKVFYSYANDDFTDISDPIYLYDRGSATIDADIVYDEADELYHMIYKNEGSGGICHITAERLTAAEGEPLGSQWGKPSGTIQQTNVAVEGGGIFRLIDSNEWVVMYDCYNNGYYQFCTTTDWESYQLVAQTTMSGMFTPRHGTVLQLHPEEVKAIVEAFPTSGLTLTGIKDMHKTIVPSAIYSTSGARLAKPQQGINIIRNTDGETRKVMMK